MSGAPEERRRRLGLRAGALFGLGAAVACAALYKASAGQSLDNPHFNVEFVTLGADASRHGVDRIVLRDSRGHVATQACRDGCDDLRIQIPSSDNSFRVEIFDASGGRLTVGGAGYVTPGLGTDRMTVKDEGGLVVKWTTLLRAKDGSFHEEIPDPGRQRPAGATTRP